MCQCAGLSRRCRAQPRCERVEWPLRSPKAACLSLSPSSALPDPQPTGLRNRASHGSPMKSPLRMNGLGALKRSLRNRLTTRRSRHPIPGGRRCGTESFNGKFRNGCRDRTNRSRSRCWPAPITHRLHEPPARRAGVRCNGVSPLFSSTCCSAPPADGAVCQLTLSSLCK